jgi:hypothetical protein
MLNEGNQIHNFMSSSGSGSVIKYGTGSDFLTSYSSGSGSGSKSQKLRFLRFRFRLRFWFQNTARKASYEPLLTPDVFAFLKQLPAVHETL